MKRMTLLNDVVIESKALVLDTTNLDNIHDVLVVNEAIIREVKDLVRHLAFDVEEYQDNNLDDLTTYVCMSFKYDYDTNIDDVYVDGDILEQLKEYIDDYYS